MLKEIMEQLEKLREVYDEMESSSIEDVYKAYEKVGDELDQLEVDLENLNDVIGGS